MRLICPPGGTVLDPFAGTGTTGEAAILEGMSAVLIEKNEDYQAEIIRRMGDKSLLTRMGRVCVRVSGRWWDFGAGADGGMILNRSGVWFPPFHRAVEAPAVFS